MGAGAKSTSRRRGPRAEADGLVWRAPHEKPFKLTGFPWFEQDRVYRRLPIKPARPLPAAVELLAWCCAGGQGRFVSDTDRIELKVRLRTPLGMDCVPVAGSGGFGHMPQTGVSGFDLYAGEPGRETMCGVTRFPTGSREYACTVFRRTRREPLSFTLNFPLYNGVEEVLIGLPRGASLRAPPPYRLDRPVVVYGTSITQGGCASRPGACYTNILSRRLNVPFVNLGFSGSGRGEPEVAESVAAIRAPALFVLDYEANSGGLEALLASLPRFIGILRARHRTVPILVVSRVRYAGDVPAPRRDAREGIEAGAHAQRQLVRRLRAAGDRGLHCLDGSRLLGADYHECSVDGGHPTDRGFFRMADAMGPPLARLLFAQGRGNGILREDTRC